MTISRVSKYRTAALNDLFWGVGADSQSTGWSWSEIETDTLFLGLSSSYVMLCYIAAAAVQGDGMVAG